MSTGSCGHSSSAGNTKRNFSTEAVLLVFPSQSSDKLPLDVNMAHQRRCVTCRPAMQHPMADLAAGQPQAGSDAPTGNVVQSRDTQAGHAACSRPLSTPSCLQSLGDVAACHQRLWPDYVPRGRQSDTMQLSAHHSQGAWLGLRSWGHAAPQAVYHVHRLAQPGVAKALGCAPASQQETCNVPEAGR